MTVHELYEKLIDVPADAEIVYQWEEITRTGEQTYENRAKAAHYDEETGKVIIT